MYIQYTRPMQHITVYKGKVPRVKPAKREDVPEAYRKEERFIKLKQYLSEISIFFIGITDFIRKEIKHERN